MCGARRNHPVTHPETATHDRRAAVASAGVATMPADDLRASDADRESAMTALRLHAGAGRLEIDELDERMSAVLAARSRADVAEALRELPDLPDAPVARAEAGNRHEHSHDPRAYLAVMVLLVGIWLLTGAGHFWPLYPALGWGLPLIIGRLSEQSRAPTATTY